MKKYLTIILFILLAFVACSKNSKKIDLKYTFEDIDNLLHETSPSHEKGDDGIKFTDYAAGAIRIEAKALVYKQLSFFAISFPTSEEARLEAVRLNQYYARNWLFDRVEGEPLLEDYLIERLKASNPNKHLQRIPKKPAGPHAESHEH